MYHRDHIKYISLCEHKIINDKNKCKMKNTSRVLDHVKI